MTSAIATTLFCLVGVGATLGLLTCLLNCWTWRSLGRWMTRIVGVGGGAMALLAALTPVNLTVCAVVIGAYGAIAAVHTLRVAPFPIFRPSHRSPGAIEGQETSG